MEIRMLQMILPEGSSSLLAFFGILFAFGATVLATAKLSPYLPKDAGREFAHDGKLSAGKPRGAGIIFVLAFVASVLLFSPLSAELVIYLLLIVVCMMTGFLDDASKTPWGEYKKGFLDLCVAALVAITFLKYNSNVVELALFHVKFTLPPVVFAILTVILVWTSVNVTNCSDGVDGLSGTLSTPSKLMMGDAGSRAMGLFISIAILKSGCPLLFIPLALVLILDGGLGLLKVSLLRFLKIHILKNVRTPLHDHVRKVWDWSNTQTVFRFAIIQIILSLAVIYAMQL